MTPVSAVLTREMLEQAMQKVRELDRAAMVERSKRTDALLALDIDMDALTPPERGLLAMAYEGHIFHPNDAKRLRAAIERTRRDRV